MLVRFVQSFIVWKRITVNSGENPDVEVECISAMTFLPSWSGLCNISSKALVASGAHSEIKKHIQMKKKSVSVSELTIGIRTNRIGSDKRKRAFNC